VSSNRQPSIIEAALHLVAAHTGIDASNTPEEEKMSIER
jgi:hypothetical protein